MNSSDVPIPIELLEKSLVILGKILYQIHDFSASTYLASSAIRFLLKYYKKSKDNTEKFFSTFLATLHLSSKVTEFAIPIKKFVEEIYKFHENPKYVPYLEAIGAKDLETEDDRNKLVKEVAEQEMNVITTLNFDFTLPNPHERCMEFIERIISWHYTTNLIVKHFVDEDCSRTVGRMLHEIIINKDFYTLDLDLSTMVLAQLALEHYGLQMAPGKPWYLFLNPTIDTKSFDNAIQSFREYIFTRWSMINFPFEEEPKLYIEKEDMMKFLVYPVETYSKDAEPNCPPPIYPFYEDCVRSQNPFPTIYDNNYADHIPLCPPVPMEMYGDKPLPPFPYRFSTKPLRDKSAPIDRKTDLRHPEARRPRDLPPSPHMRPADRHDDRDDRRLVHQGSFPHSNPRPQFDRDRITNSPQPQPRALFRDRRPREDDFEFEFRSSSQRRFSPPRNPPSPRRGDYWLPPQPRRDMSPPRRPDRPLPPPPPRPPSMHDDRRDLRRYNDDRGDHRDDRGPRRDDRRDQSRLSHSRSNGDIRNSTRH